MKQAAMLKRVGAGWFLVFFLAPALFLSGCRAISDFRQAYETAAIEWRHPDDGYGRRVLLLVSSSAHVPEGFMQGGNLSEMLSSRLSKSLSETCPKMIVDVPPKAEKYQGDTQTPFSLCARYRNSGDNAVVSCDIDSLEAVRRHRGFWRTINPFDWIGRKALEEKYPSMFRIRLRLRAWDTFTAAPICVKTIEATFDPAYAIDENKAVSGTVPGFLPTLSDLCEKGAEALCKAVFDQFWTAYVIDTGPDGVTISAGSKVGLAAGTVLDVWSAGDVIKSTNGNRFWLPGKKIGTIKIIRLNQDTSVCVPVSGKAPALGCVVLKDGFSF